MNRKILLLIWSAVALVGWVSLYQRNAERANDLARQKASEQERVFRELAIVSCKTAIERSVAPAKVFDWPGPFPFQQEWGFRETSTGFRIDLLADLGVSSVRMACYPDKAGAVIQIVDAR